MKFRLLVCLLSINFSVWAQLPNQAFYDLHHRDSILPERWKSTSLARSNNVMQKVGKELFLDFNSLFFCRNNEYFNDIESGHTFFGYQWLPTLNWKPFAQNDFYLRGGIYLQQNFGEDSLAAKTPIFSLSYKAKNTTFVFGTLYGGLEHRLVEPLYRFERGLYDRIENGFQILHQTKFIDADVWIDWKQTTYNNLYRPEILQPGARINFNFLNKQNHIFETHLQATNYHEGGVNTNAINRSNLCLGANYTYNLNEKSSLFFKPYYLYALDHSEELTQPFKDGFGWFVNSGFQYKHLTSMISYWKGEEFFSPRGMPYMGSFSYENFYAMARQRELIFLRLIYTKPIFAPYFTIDLRIEPIYDIRNQIFDYSFGIYFIYRKGI
jgi:hypothetical protein